MIFCVQIILRANCSPGAVGIIKGDGVGTKFASSKSVRLSKMGIWHKTSGDVKDRPSDAMRLNWTL